VLLAAGILFTLLLAAGVIGTLHFWPGVNLAPKDYQPDDGATVVTVEGKKLYDRIVRVLPGGVRVVFLLISPKDPRDPPAFYIMRDKLCNDVFQAFVDANPDLVKDQEWHKGAQVINKANDQYRDLETKDGRLPVFRVTVEEAHQCALWLGGDVPTTHEWLTAAGRRMEGAIGPFKGKIEDLKPDDIAINREDKGPMPVGEAVKDVSPRGCRDMAGNGREWTRTNATKDTPEDDDVQVTLPLPAGRPSPMIWLLGQTYEAAKPMRFDDAPERVPYGEPPNLARFHYVGFRVAIKIPAQP
jgi:formylglycine-generating enzyme required for sulfatase activity